MSTDKQAEAGLSLDAQTTKIRAMAMVKGVELDDVLVDAGASAKSLDRPEMARLLDLVDRGSVATIIVAKLDRLTRSLADLAALLKRFERHGVSLVSINESLDTRSSTGRLLIHILGSVAEWELDEAGKRTSDVLQHKRDIGERAGTLPYGFQLAVDGVRTHQRWCQTRGVAVTQCPCGGRLVQLEPAPVEQRLLAHVRELKAAGRSTRQIAATLTAEGATTRRGTVWHFQNVAHLLRIRRAS